jgi:hypothetical protein
MKALEEYGDFYPGRHHCPFCERGPRTNLTVYPDNRYKCFRCGAYGLVSEDVEVEVIARASVFTKEGIINIPVLEYIQRFKPLTDEALSYLNKRKIPQENVKPCLLRYCQVKNAIVFPTTSKCGTIIVGMKYRFLSSDAPVKTMSERLSSADHPMGLGLFKKGCDLVLVEGEISYAIHVNGSHGLNVMAVLGTTVFTDAKAEIIADLVGDNTVYTLFDNDNAGQSGVLKAITKLKKWGVCAKNIIPDVDVDFYNFNLIRT